MTRPQTEAECARGVVRTPYGDEVRKADAMQAAQERFYNRWLTLCADQAAEMARIRREGM